MLHWPETTTSLLEKFIRLLDVSSHYFLVQICSCWSMPQLFWSLVVCWWWWWCLCSQWLKESAEEESISDCCVGVFAVSDWKRAKRRLCGHLSVSLQNVVIGREQRGDYLIGCLYLCSQWLKESEEGTIWAKLCRWVSPSLICLVLVLFMPTIVLCFLIWTCLSSCVSSWWFSDKIEQVVPHITDCIQDWIERVARVPVDGLAGTADVCVIELGGTVGIFCYLA